MSTARGLPMGTGMRQGAHIARVTRDDTGATYHMLLLNNSINNTLVVQNVLRQVSIVLPKSRLHRFIEPGLITVSQIHPTLQENLPRLLG